MNSLKENILRTLLYYDIFNYPLKADELFYLLPQNSISKKEFIKYLNEISNLNSPISSKEGYFFVGKNDNCIEFRKFREKCSSKAWKIAGLVTQLIKRFPYVRAVFVTGTLSKNSSVPESDLDFMVVTKTGRLWLCRTLLMLFKKIFLLNSHKYFCINYFISEESLEIEEKNIFTATEIYHVKSTFNAAMQSEFVNANKWIKEYFPNFKFENESAGMQFANPHDSQSILRKIFEVLIPTAAADRLESYFFKITVKHFRKKYNQLCETDLNQMFKSTHSVSKNHPGNMQKVILSKYRFRLKEFNLS